MADLLEAGRQPWERQKGESSRALRAFAMYRDMGAERRSLRRLAEAMGVSLRLVSRWSRQHHWVERCAAWDDEVDRMAREEQARAIAEMCRQHAEEAVRLRLAAFKSLMEQLEGFALEDLNPADLLKIWNETVKVERLIRGEPETVQQQQITGKGGGPVRVAGQDLSRLSDDELAQLERLLSKAGEPDAGTDT